MPSAHLVDPELAPLIAALPAFDLRLDTLKQNRAMLEVLAKANPALPSKDVTVREQVIAGRDGAPDVRVICTAPRAAGVNRPLILHIHGGGYVMGSADAIAATDALYAQELDAVVVAVDYRLAPETPHPGPVEDCYAALAWTYAEASALGISRSKLAVTGESGGGGLAAALARISHTSLDFSASGPDLR